MEKKADAADWEQRLEAAATTAAAGGSGAGVSRGGREVCVGGRWDDCRWRQQPVLLVYNAPLVIHAAGSSRCTSCTGVHYDCTVLTRLPLRPPLAPFGCTVRTARWVWLTVVRQSEGKKKHKRSKEKKKKHKHSKKHKKERHHSKKKRRHGECDWVGRWVRGERGCGWLSVEIRTKSPWSPGNSHFQLTPTRRLQQQQQQQ